MSIFEKLRSGQRVFVINPDNDKRFSIEPAYWEGIRLGYTFRNEGGDIAKGYNGITASTEDVEDCCAQLVERDTPAVVVAWKTPPMKAPAFWYYHAKCLPARYKIDGNDVQFVYTRDVECIECKELI